MKKLYIGIDPGTKTGIAIYNKQTRKLTALHTVKIHQAFAIIEDLMAELVWDIHVVVEDARLIRLPLKMQKKERAQGAGSVKRDCAIWEDYLSDLRNKFCKGDKKDWLTFRMADPKQNKNKAMNEKAWVAMTGWDKKVSEHARAAATYVFGL